ncbi:MAG: hypothetical protein DRG31_05840 [Deltaproteobacteria bacterium]|nr:MAG: hypothetical protein DRG31_05840 [Deltaproteobacteria bacterium]
MVDAVTFLFRNFLLWLHNNMAKKYDEARARFEKNLPDDVDRVVWVHELCQCSEKKRFEIDFPELAETVRFKPAVMLGELVHIACERWGLEYTPSIYSKRIKLKDETVIVAGMPDYVSKALSTVVDFKYTANIGSEPLQHHRLQVALYKWLCNVENGEIWYFTHDAFKAFPVFDTVDEEQVKWLIASEKTPRWKDWECKYCEFRQLCRHGA